MKKNAFRLTFNVNCSGRSDKFARSETVLTQGRQTESFSFFFSFVVLLINWLGRKRTGENEEECLLYDTSRWTLKAPFWPQWTRSWDGLLFGVQFYECNWNTRQIIYWKIKASEKKNRKKENNFHANEKTSNERKNFEAESYYDFSQQSASLRLILCVNWKNPFYCTCFSSWCFVERIKINCRSVAMTIVVWPLA